jgi:N-acetylneuraminic acid mutarotase
MGWGVYQGKIYVVGGENSDNYVHAVFGAFEVYDPATNNWMRLPPIASPRHGLNGAVIGNRLYIMGGHIAAGGDGGATSHSNGNDAFEFDK